MKSERKEVNKVEEFVIFLCNILIFKYLSYEYSCVYL